MKKDSKKREISFSNYVKLGLVIIVTVFAVIIGRNIYVSKQNNDLNTPILRDYLTHEINSNETITYINENNDSILYLGISKDENCRKFENSIKSYIKSNNLKDDIIYVNVQEENSDSFINEFNKTYNVDLDTYPAIVYFKNGVVAKKISGDITKNEFKDFVESIKDED